MPRVALLLLAGLLACSGDKTATGPSYLDIDGGVPVNWSVVGQNSAAYVMGLDRVTVHSGSAALAIYSIDANPALFRGVGQFIKADQYRGKRVRLRAWVKQQNISGTVIGLWMRVDGPFVTQAFDNFSTRPLTGTSDWHQVEVILDVPNDAIGIALGALMSGKGEFWVDDMTFDVVATSGPTTNILDAPTPTSIDATQTYLNAGSVPFNLGFEGK